MSEHPNGISTDRDPWLSYDDEDVPDMLPEAAADVEDEDEDEPIN